MIIEVNNMNKLFEMVNLERYYETPAGVVKALDGINIEIHEGESCLLYTSPSPRDVEESRMPSSA